MICISRRAAAQLAAQSSVMSVPSKTISPGGRLDAGAASSRPSVDLPQPDSPTRPSVSPRRTSKVDAVDRVHLRRPCAEAAPRWIGKCFLSSCASSSDAGVDRAVAFVALDAPARGAAEPGAPCSQSQHAAACRRPEQRRMLVDARLERVVAARLRSGSPAGQSSGLGTVPGITRSGSACVIAERGIDCSSASRVGVLRRA